MISSRTGEREAKINLLLWIRHYAIVTMNVEKATERSRLSQAAVAGDCSGLRSWTRPCHPGAPASGRPAGLRLPGCDDSSHECRNVGRAHATGGLDTGSHSAQHSYVGRGVDADDLLACVSGATASPRMLCGERFSS